MAPHSSGGHHELLNRRTPPPPPHVVCCVFLVCVAGCMRSTVHKGRVGGRRGSNTYVPLP